MCMNFVQLCGLFMLLIEENILQYCCVYLCLAQIVYVLYSVFELTILYIVHANIVV